MRQLIRRVVCGISGGVDSAVAALLLKRKGYEVIGLFMKNWDITNEQGKCTMDKDVEDACFLCDHIGIPLHEVNFVKKFWNDVFSCFIDDYQHGFTPNPDILCNKYIKFDAFLDHALNKLKADAIATGHYARTSIGADLDKVSVQQGVKLLKAMDPLKDQTFFLSQISQKALHKTLFPLGDLTKDMVKRIAMSEGMGRIVKKKESMGICFIGSRNFQSFIEEYIEPRPGRFVDVETGNVVGTHKGTHYWTIGQRALIGGQKRAWYIVKINACTQDITVALGNDHPSLYTATFTTHPPHWIHNPPCELPQHTFESDFQFQHVCPAIRCTVNINSDGCLAVCLSQPMRAITPGQFAVFYRGQECLGSARISHSGPSLYDLKLGERTKIQDQIY